MYGIVVLTAFHDEKLQLKSELFFTPLSAKLTLMTLDQLKQDLFERFILAFDEFDRIAEKKAQARNFVYSQLPRYHVSKFDGKKIPVGGKTLSAPPESNPQVYGLNAQGHPCYHSSEHTWNKVYWEGFYDITTSFIEYIEFDLQSKKPVEIIRMLLDNGRKTGFQHLRVNGKGFSYAYDGLSSRDTVEQLLRTPNDLISSVDLYHYGEQRIVTADCWHAMPGMNSIIYKKEYHYNAAGKLQEIKDILPDNSTQYAHVDIPEGVTLEQLSEQVAMQMANAIADTLAETDFSHPLAILHLGYQEYGSYEPLLTVVLQNKKEKAIKKLKGSDLMEELFFMVTDFIEPDHEPYERLLTAFIDKVMEDENEKLATAMIRKAAYILTTEKVFGKVPLSDDFFAYAVDWSLAPEDNELIQIFRECGMREEVLEQWRKREIFGEGY
jgi:hypothetical protein